MPAARRLGPRRQGRRPAPRPGSPWVLRESGAGSSAVDPACSCRADYQLLEGGSGRHNRAVSAHALVTKQAVLRESAVPLAHTRRALPVHLLPRGVRMSYPFSHAFRRPVSFVVIAALASLGTVVLMPSVVSASGTDTWTGAAGDGNWGTANNWAAHTVPASGDNVVFPAGAPATVTLNVIATVTNITLDGDYLFPVGAPLNIVGNATISQPVSGTN